ncbi:MULTISPECIES: sensor domain-containing phosphodiesterase [Pseudomonas]|jgi:EAL domain-containing protein (putative c-di-GMP-specific phosphodiesterase class I)|nr:MULTISPECIES: sensor domain-containing phosphodiesterase [Pseudomonas]MCU1742143.1 sensor domain-containing phosphodiesterase [Pseudomonas sp. 20S_6.2_Bac1]
MKKLTTVELMLLRDREEEERLAALHAFDLMDVAREECFERICRLVASRFQAPVAIVSLIDKDRQWFLASTGFSAQQAPELELSFCAHTIRQSGVFVVDNACLDPRFADFPVVQGDDALTFYAGAPLRTEGGYAIGSVCILDTVSHDLTPDDQAALEDFAALIMQLIERQHLLKRVDAVSGLSNRTQFLSDLQGLILAGETRKRVLVTVDALDTDWAHRLTVAEGMVPFEAVLRDMASRIQAFIGTGIKIYHVMVKGFAFTMQMDAVEARGFLPRLVDWLRRAPISENLPMVPTVCAGLLEFESGSQTARELLRKGLFALETARQKGQPYAYYNHQEDTAFRRLFSLLPDITPALKSDDVFLVYQPRFSLRDGAHLSAEALIRWNHRLHGFISPAEFIPIVEKSSLIHSVTDWVIERVVMLIASTGYARDKKISLNLSSRDFYGRNVADVIAQRCAAHGVDPAMLEAEITEGEWLRSSAGVIEQLQQLRNMGVDVAIDDFGTGYSNFSYLHKIPANILKLDQSMIFELEYSAQHQRVAKSIIGVARDLGYRTVAEGVESFGCLEILKHFGCDEAQGYFLSRPVEEALYFQQAALDRFPLKTG